MKLMLRFLGFLCLIGPLLFGRDLHWSPLVWLAMAAGSAIVAACVGILYAEGQSREVAVLQPGAGALEGTIWSV